MNNNKEIFSVNGHFMVLAKYSLRLCFLPYDFSALIWFFLYSLAVWLIFLFLFVKHSPGFYNLRGLIFGDEWYKQTNKNNFQLEILNAAKFYMKGVVELPFINYGAA